MNSNERNKVGKQAGIVGLTMNILLSVGKIVAGKLANSQSILADGINSLSDTLSSIITIFGFQIAGKPADNDHPYGHERSEYIAGFTIALIMLVLGFDVVKNSVASFFSDNKMTFSEVSFVIMCISIVIKILMTYYYRYQAKKIDSKTLKAASVDARNDIAMTAIVLIALLLSPYISFNLDAILGSILGVYICFVSMKMIGDFMSELLGVRPSDQTLIDIKTVLDGNEEIFGYHDLMIHSYGSETSFGTVHVELDQNMSLIKAHAIIDKLEHEIYQKSGVNIVAHADPLDISNPELHNIYQTIKRYLKEHYPSATFHDLRLVAGVLSFDIVLNGLTCNDDILYDLGVELQQKGYTYKLDISFDIQQLI